MNPLQTPVLFMVYARPNTTARVFDQIRKVRPSRLYLAADGPKSAHADSQTKVAAVRDILKNIDWACEVKYLYRDQNLGCSLAVTGAIEWFFSHEEAGIVLEDDCLPHTDFFYFCQELLHRYAKDTRVFHISGLNLQFGQAQGDASYYFSRIASVWGWAGWRRSWKFYDIEMSRFPAFKASGMIRHILVDPSVAAHAMNVLEQNFTKKIISWDHQYGFSLAVNNGLCITPNKNLISNLGFLSGDDPEAKDEFFLSKMETQPLTFPLTHPWHFIPSGQADLYHVRWDVRDTAATAAPRLSGREFQNTPRPH